MRARAAWGSSDPVLDVSETLSFGAGRREGGAGRAPA